MEKWVVTLSEGLLWRGTRRVSVKPNQHCHFDEQGLGKVLREEKSFATDIPDYPFQKISHLLLAALAFARAGSK
jgi:hypothetical protein